MSSINIYLYVKSDACWWQIRSHAQKYFLKVQKSGTSEHVPPPRPKRKAAHPYPQKAPKNGQDHQPFLSLLPPLSFSFTIPFSPFVLSMCVYACVYGIGVGLFASTSNFRLSLLCMYISSGSSCHPSAWFISIFICFFRTWICLQIRCTVSSWKSSNWWNCDNMEL